MFFTREEKEKALVYLWKEIKQFNCSLTCVLLCNNTLTKLANPNGRHILFIKLYVSFNTDFILLK